MDKGNTAFSTNILAAAVGFHSDRFGLFVWIYMYLFSVSIEILDRSFVFNRLFALICRSISLECGVHAAILPKTVIISTLHCFA